MEIIMCDNCKDSTYYSNIIKDMDTIIKDGWVSVVTIEQEPCWLCAKCAAIMFESEG